MLYEAPTCAYMTANVFYYICIDIYIYIFVYVNGSVYLCTLTADNGDCDDVDGERVGKQSGKLRKSVVCFQALMDGFACLCQM